MRLRPLLGLCAAFAAGVFLAWCSAMAVWYLALGCLAATGYGLARRRRATVLAACLMLTAWLGAVRYLNAQVIAANDPSRLPATSLTLTGTVDDEITVEDDPRTDEPATARFVMNVTSARLESTARGAVPIGVSGRVAVRVTLQSRVTHTAPGPEQLPGRGDRLELHGRLERPDGPRNPGGFDYRAFLARRGIYSTLAVRQPEQMRVLGRSGWFNPILALAHALRQGVLHACRRALPAPADGLLAGILIGDRSRIPQSIQEEFERTGTTHVLATAGLHVGIVLCVLMWLLCRSRVPRRPALCAAIVALALYSVMAGERAAVLRAVMIAIVVLAGELLEREPDFPNALALAAFLLLLLNPCELFNSGFQMTFATATTIAFVMPMFARFIRPPGLNRPDNAAARPLRDFYRLVGSLAALSLAAQLGAAPLVAYYFYNVSLVSVAANALVVPAVFVIIALGFPMAVLVSIHPVLAVPIAVAVRALAGYLLCVVHYASEFRLTAINVAPPAPLWIAGYYVCLWSVAWYVRTRAQTTAPITPRQTAIRRLAVCMGGVLPLTALCGSLMPRPREMRVTFLDVGQGDACVLESPSGKVMLIDTGGLVHDGEDNEGRRVVAPYLRYRGINAIDAIVLTHPHADHIGGAESLISRFATAEVMDDGDAYGSPLVPRLVGRALRDGAQVVTARSGQSLDFGDGVTADVLGPSELLAGQGANNASVVLRIRYGRTAFLLTGDAEAPEEAEICSEGRDVACDVLKVGHHGSHTSSTAPFIAAAHPKISVISVGKRNLYGHPSPEVVDRLTDIGARVYRTDHDGAVICHSDGASVTVQDMIPRGF